MSGAKSCLIVFARAPSPGRVKTRLLLPPPGGAGEATRALTPDEAARLYTAFIADVLDKGAAAGFARRCLYVDGALDAPIWRDLAVPRDYALRPQADGDLGTRLHTAIAAEFAAGAEAVVVIGSDSPTLPTGYLQRARALLTATPPVDVVLGPATDGGYYLIGLRAPRRELFSDGIPWSTAGVLPATLRRLAELGETGVVNRAALLPFFYDCDTPEALRLLVAHLRKSRQPTFSEALGDVTAPHTQQALSELSLF